MTKRNKMLLVLAAVLVISAFVLNVVLAIVLTAGVAVAMWASGALR